MENIKVVLWGLGAMGSGMAKDILLNKQGIEIVGAIGQNPAKIGKDLGEVLELGRKLGVTVSDNPEQVLKNVKADIVLHATQSFTKDVLFEISLIVKSGKNVITIAEEMSAPQVETPDLAALLDKLAKENSVTILGTGVNPGFVLDTLILTMTGACQVVNKIRAARVNDLSPFGPTVMKTQGVGTTVEEFHAGVKAGTIVGHIGFKQSMYLIAKGLGWELDDIVETREPIVTNVYRETPHVKVQPGMVAGCRHIARGYKNGEEIITLEHPQQIHPELEGVKTGDYIVVEGTPTIKFSDEQEIPGGIGTMATAVNMIPQVINAQAGLGTMPELPVITALMGDVRRKIKR
ncbi:2,4-diaminopentanoate dehydrogenase [Sporomusa sp.]|uniref:2,4-diaminopentanoate dehydrogenase n=1 Tax=Sporomusa sp. TaxID=2078658 RepID=UPI002B625EA0|nr:2,4-diaminopentanoate dehydrogenase [Sporomusa sp.]HWR42739.1 2,4-diaminopentanoate dehydrogenase [Sporomusa sp.]